MKPSEINHRTNLHNLINYISDKLFDELNVPNMEHRLNTIKADLYDVFVVGQASGLQIVRVFLIFALPIIGACMWGLR